MAGAAKKTGGGSTLGNAGAIIDHAFGGKSTGAGTNALTQKKPDQGALSNIGAGSGTTALGGQATSPAPQTGPQGGLRAPATRPGLTEGTVPGYGPDSPASGGQVVSALDIASSITNPPAMLAKGMSEDDTSRTLLGRAWDNAFGGTPGTPVSTRNPIANNTNARGDVRQGDPVLADRASGAATAALLGDSPDSSGAGTDALFSDVSLSDRRKPRSDMAGTNMLLKAA